MSDKAQDAEHSGTEHSGPEHGGPEHGGTEIEETADGVPPEAVVRVDIDAAPDDVWQALTTDDGLAGWLGDGSSIGTDVGDEIDLHDVVTGERKRGVLDEVSPGHRLGYTWWPETKPGAATRVAISIEPTHTGTRVTVVESRPLIATAGPAVAGSAMSRGLRRSSGPKAMAMAPVRSEWAWRTALLTVMCESRSLAAAGRGTHGR